MNFHIGMRDATAKDRAIRCAHLLEKRSTIYLFEGYAKNEQNQARRWLMVIKAAELVRV